MNLEQQKKRARELLRALRAGDADALARLRAHHTRWATVDQAQRFARSKTVGAHFGLAPRRFQSGERDYDGRVSKCGDAMMRTGLYEAAQVLLTRTRTWS